MKKEKKKKSHVCIIVGELSGDLHAAQLVRELRSQNRHLEFSGTGGPSLRGEKVNLLADINDLSVVGFSEVLKHYRKIKRIFDRLLDHIREMRPKLVICVDYPGFNLRLIPHIHKMGIPIVYYISPQIWAWKYGRIKTIKKHVNLMIPLLPFEKTLYRKEGVPVAYFGHPLAEEMLKLTRLLPGPKKNTPPVITFLPGSRRHEVESLIPVMLEIAKILRNKYPKAGIRFACADSIQPQFMKTLMGENPYPVFQGQTYRLVRSSNLVITASGTASLETSLLSTPVIVVYKVRWLSYLLFKLLVRVRFISLTNLIMGKGVIKEFIAPKLDVQCIANEAMRILDSAQVRGEMIRAFNLLRRKLFSGKSYRRAADLIDRKFLR